MRVDDLQVFELELNKDVTLADLWNIGALRHAYTGNYVFEDEEYDKKFWKMAESDNFEGYVRLDSDDIDKSTSWLIENNIVDYRDTYYLYSFVNDKIYYRNIYGDNWPKPCVVGIIRVVRDSGNRGTTLYFISLPLCNEGKINGVEWLSNLPKNYDGHYEVHSYFSYSSIKGEKHKDAVFPDFELYIYKKIIGILKPITILDIKKWIKELPKTDLYEIVQNDDDLWLEAYKSYEYVKNIDKYISHYDNNTQGEQNCTCNGVECIRYCVDKMGLSKYK